MIATVAAFRLVDLLRFAFEIGAGQVLAQHLKLGAEKVLPALLAMLKQRRFVGHNAISAAIEPILSRHRVVHPQQFSHRGAIEPWAVNAELTARIDQSIHHE
jgi:hypothetical protein